MNGDSRINFCMERTSHECLLMFVSHVHKEWQTNDLLTELAVCGYHTQCTLDEHYGPSVGQKLTPSTVSFALVTITRETFGTRFRQKNTHTQVWHEIIVRAKLSIYSCALDEHYGPSVGQKLTPSTVSFALVTITRDIKCIALAHAYVSKIPIRKCGTKL
jgi:hypothetical protein